MQIQAHLRELRFFALSLKKAEPSERPMTRQHPSNSALSLRLTGDESHPQGEKPVQALQSAFCTGELRRHELLLLLLLLLLLSQLQAAESAPSQCDGCFFLFFECLDHTFTFSHFGGEPSGP